MSIDPDKALDELVRLSEEMGGYEMSPRDQHRISLEKGCPDCGSREFHPGPRGGMAINIKCANPNCGSKFCYCGPLLPSYRIDNDDVFYDDSALRQLRELP